jgi:hypothetical protein
MFMNIALGRLLAVSLSAIGLAGVVPKRPVPVPGPTKAEACVQCYGCRVCGSISPGYLYCTFDNGCCNGHISCTC